MVSVASARQALYLWLWARQQKQRFTLASKNETPSSAPWREELGWLSLDWDGEADTGDNPDWATRLPAIEESEPSPWGQWKIGRAHV